MLRGCDAVVHLANIPAPGRATPAATFNANVTMNFNVFHAAAALGLSSVVWASSETTLGLPFGGGPEQSPGAPGELRYAPVDEDHFPYPATTYALSKVTSEGLAEQVSRWSGIPFTGLRISNIMEPSDYEQFPSFWVDPHLRKWNLWGYVDVRDVAMACRLGLEADVTGARNVIIAAADTVMNRPSRELLADVFPDVPVTGDVDEFGTLLAISRARELIGYQPGTPGATSWPRTSRPPGARPGAPDGCTTGGPADRHAVAEVVSGHAQTLRRYWPPTSKNASVICCRSTLARRASAPRRRCRRSERPPSGPRAPPTPARGSGPGSRGPG